MEDLERSFGINCEKQRKFAWNFIEGGLEDEEEEEEDDDGSKSTEMEMDPKSGLNGKQENYGEEKEQQLCLKLNLNYQEVMDAWCDRRPLLTAPTSSFYGGEVSGAEEERGRREASVIRYKEKRQNRFFSKKIRYEVRKLNADKRSRLKGRFVKRVVS